MKQILVCGDAMVDEYWFGDVNRISPEAPVPCLKVLRKETRLGAAANVAENCKAMGADVVTATVEGATKIRLVARNQHIVRADFDVSKCSARSLIDVRVAVGIAMRKGVRMVILSDYGKGVRAEFPEAIRRANEVSSTVLVDPKGHDYSVYRGAHLVKPNLDEMRVVLGGWSSEDQLERKVRALMSETGIERILLTRAAEGMTLFSIEGVYSVPSAVREVYDVTGAGDTAIAALAVALTRGFDWREAVEVANKAAGLACGKFGTSVVTKEEIFGDGSG